MLRTQHVIVLLEILQRSRNRLDALLAIALSLTSDKKAIAIAVKRESAIVIARPSQRRLCKCTVLNYHHDSNRALSYIDPRLSLEVYMQFEEVDVFKRLASLNLNVIEIDLAVPTSERAIVIAWSGRTCLGLPLEATDVAWE